MAEHKHGHMDITEQERTFVGFVQWVTRTVIVILVLLVLLALVNG
ncbi:aa3-type cytochrome c oxidase subunit IV [Roseitranquillus sediminis]|nr:aa3-type cytochrome c oxidase subunit IV [Roseitranquillus sediminis]MBM9593333.1 aa3-type cytochrome c oxidase subunit IV [Roseitranquillus sediminis]